VFACSYGSCFQFDPSKFFHPLGVGGNIAAGVQIPTVFFDNFDAASGTLSPHTMTDLKISQGPQVMMYKVSLATVDTVSNITAMIFDFEVVGVLGHVSSCAFAK
jgi:hypothetical protein